MTLYSLDTDAVIDVLKGFSSSVTFIQNLLTQGHILATNAIVIAEVYSGLRLHERGSGEVLMDSLTYLPPSRDAARRASDWRYAYARTGTALSLTDTLIAATAREHDATVVTANIADYPMQDVAVAGLPRASGARHAQ
jgi:predicted nucleic acid-binding protein